MSGSAKMDHGMTLNPTKSDAILFGTSQHLKTMSSLSSVKLDDSSFQTPSRSLEMH